MIPDTILRNRPSSRRKFLQRTAALGAAMPAEALLSKAHAADAPGMNILGPRPGYSPQLGTLVSEMIWMRTIMLSSVRGMSQADLDFLLDAKANTIGAMLMHLAATDAYYHEHTLGGKAWGAWDAKTSAKWDVAMNLGEPARKAIKGNSLQYYLDQLSETRESTLAEFRKRDDSWLMAVDKEWPWGPTNNYCKWFHVCEHESNHNGQIKFLKSRLPGAKTENG